MLRANAGTSLALAFPTSADRASNDPWLSLVCCDSVYILLGGRICPRYVLRLVEVQ